MNWSLILTVLLVGLCIGFCISLTYLLCCIINSKFRAETKLVVKEVECSLPKPDDVRQTLLKKNVSGPLVDDIPTMRTVPKVESSFGQNRIGEVKQ